MKHDPAKLIYHSMHKRPMPGCLPLFFAMSALAVAGVMLLVEVKLPEPLRPRGVGNVFYQNDELTRFQVRQHSALPLQLPVYADPTARLPLPSHELPLHREVKLETPPAQTFSSEAPDSAVLNAEELLALPPENPAPAETQAMP